MLRKVLLTIYFTAILFCAGCLVYNNFINKNSSALIENRHAVTFMVALFLGFMKMYNPSKKRNSLKYYQNFYKDIIKDSFSEDKKSYKQLIKSLAYFNVDKFNKAITILESLQQKCITPNEKYAVNLFLALNYEEINQTDKALSTYESLLKCGLADTIVYSNLGLLYSDNGLVENAIEIYKKAIFLDSKNPSAYNNIANAYFKIGEYELVIENAKMALDLDSKMLPSIKLLAITYALLENYEESEKYQKRAIANGISKKDMDLAIKIYLG